MSHVLAASNEGMEKAPGRAPPLCVDLDGTLTRSDTLMEGLLAIPLGRGFLGSAKALMLDGKAGLKRFVGQSASLDPSSLLYFEPFLDYVRGQRASGRQIILVTAADISVARAVAAQLGFFDDIMASENGRNLKGEAKASALVERFGRKGFSYAGNDASDLYVWREAATAIIVNAASGVAGAAHAVCVVEAEFPPPAGRARAAISALRPQQWSKNLLVFIPLFTAHVLSSPSAWFAALAAFAAFCATASAIYIVNDLSDLQADRRHSRKRRRPFASGALPIRDGLLAVPALLALGAVLAALSGTLPVLSLYAGLSIGYSLRLKELPLVDVFVLAGLYTVRICAGAMAIGHELSLWLLGFSVFLFLSLALVKRVEELRAASDSGRNWLIRRGYMAADIAVLQIFGVASAFSAALVLALFVQSEATAHRYASPGLLWAIVPLVLFWQCRIWLSTARGYMHDDPIVYAARDWVSWLVAGSAFFVLVLAKSIGGLLEGLL